MKSIFVESTLTFNKDLLHPNWIQENFQLKEDAIISFIGPTQLILSDKDQVIFSNKNFFFKPKMLHFIIRHNHTSYKEIILHQRLFIHLINQQLPIQTQSQALNIYYQKKQVSITHIQINEPTALFHIGLFIESESSPPLQGLNQLDINTKSFSASIMQSYTQEMNLIPKNDTHHNS